MDHPEDRISKIVHTFYDGKQFSIKIPKEISEYLGMKKGYQVQLDLYVPEKDVDVLKSKTLLTVIPRPVHKKKKRGIGYGKKK
jgi:hypothetical protein